MDDFKTEEQRDDQKKKRNPQRLSKVLLQIFYRRSLVGAGTTQHNSGVDSCVLG